jgi:hypothetical protein
MIPDLLPQVGYPYSLLPDGVHACDEEALRLHFVDRFPGSRTRRTIYEGFRLLRHEAISRAITATQWVDGSFVEGKPDPGDVDVISFCDYDFLNGLDSESQRFVVQSLGGREATKARYQTHTFLVPSCPTGHPYRLVFEQARAYWRTWFGKTREIPNPPGPNLPGRAKGFLQMALGAVGEAPIIASERNTE